MQFIRFLHPPLLLNPAPHRSAGNGAGPHGGADICIAFSADARDWQKSATPLYAHGGHPKGYDAMHAHKVWLTSDGAGTLYLYYTGVFAGGRGILLLTSKPVV